MFVPVGTDFQFSFKGPVELGAWHQLATTTAVALQADIRSNAINLPAIRATWMAFS
jgi:hypothetical protein